MILGIASTAYAEGDVANGFLLDDIKAKLGAILATGPRGLRKLAAGLGRL